MRHPATRAEDALEESGQIQVYVQAWPVQPKARRADFDVGKILHFRISKALHQEMNLVNICRNAELFFPMLAAG